jgi:hypothetical protein
MTNKAPVSITASFATVLAATLTFPKKGLEKTPTFTLAGLRHTEGAVGLKQERLPFLGMGAHV